MIIKDSGSEEACIHGFIHLIIKNKVSMKKFTIISYILPCTRRHNLGEMHRMGKAGVVKCKFQSKF